MASHDQLVARALTWLRSNKYPLVLSGMASCDEIPDAIGFATNRSAVIEVKTSRSDFHRDRNKYKRCMNERGHSFPYKLIKSRSKTLEGFTIVDLPNMGSQRYFLSEPDVITPEMMQEHHADCGLLHLHGRIVKKIISAPMRPSMRHNLAAEVKYLQYSMRHLIGNLGSAGVKVDLLEAVKMFGKQAVDIAEWKRKQLVDSEARAVVNG